jgi:C1A family cysteine protease
MITRIKTQLAAEIPSIFGFTTFTSMDSEENENGHIPFPDRREKSDGGHAVMAVGYNDDIEIVVARAGSQGLIGIRDLLGGKYEVGELRIFRALSSALSRSQR